MGSRTAAAANEDTRVPNLDGVCQQIHTACFVCKSCKNPSEPWMKLQRFGPTTCGREVNFPRMTTTLSRCAIYELQAGIEKCKSDDSHFEKIRRRSWMMKSKSQILRLSYWEDVDRHLMLNANGLRTLGEARKGGCSTRGGENWLDHRRRTL